VSNVVDVSFKTIPIEVDGISDWLWPSKDTELWYGNTYDWDQLKGGIKTYCKKFDVAIQAGGACGMYPRLLANFFGHVYTFEPEPVNFHCLVNNCRLHTITKINGALGDTNMFVSVDHGGFENAGVHRVSRHEKNCIPVFTIDQFNYEEVDLIQLDCEGYEENVVRGAEKTIEKFKPVITLETVTPHTRSYLENLGYKDMGRYGHCDTLFAVE
jgi:FkbM family methyltransferase